MRTLTPSLVAGAMGALLVTALLGATGQLNPASNPLGLRADGIEFPDGSVQTTAAAGPASWQPVQRYGNVTIENGDRCAVGAIWTVPLGKRLVIEYVGAMVWGTSTFQVTDISFETQVYDYGRWLHWLPRLTERAQILGDWTQGTGHMVRWYGDGGTQVRFQACRNDAAGNDRVAYQFSGYVLDVPARTSP